MGLEKSTQVNKINGSSKFRRTSRQDSRGLQRSKHCEFDNEDENSNPNVCYIVYALNRSEISLTLE